MGACASLLLSSAAIPLTAQAYTEGLNAAHSVADMVTQVDQPCIKFLNAMILVVSASTSFLPLRIGGTEPIRGTVAALSDFHKPPCERGR